ncbi:MAG: hypothetical protein ACREJ3_09915 [Polyangiaceae bacterium]
MRSRSYPLAALVELRDARVDAAAQTLAQARRDHDLAERARGVAQSRSDDQARAAESVRLAQQRALALGEQRVADVARTDAWEHRARAERDRLAQHLAKAEEAAAGALGRDQRARRDVAARRADAQVIEEHRARWDEAQRKRVEMTEEEASLEAWRPRP